jgi:hypothetical protein
MYGTITMKSLKLYNKYILIKILKGINKWGSNSEFKLPEEQKSVRYNKVKYGVTEH